MKNREEVLQERIERRNSRHEIGNNISWSAIFAGAVTFIAVMFLLSFIGSSIGFATLDFQSSNPFNGLFTGVGIWTVVQLLVSLFAAGFVGGLAAKRVGLLHGFLSWALSMALVVVMLFTALTATAKTAANAAGSVAGAAGQVAGKAASTVSENVSSLSSTAFEKVAQEVEGLDAEELQANVEKYLQDSENEKLRPGYLQSQVDVSVEEIKQAAKDIALNPENAEKIAKDTADKIGARAEDIANSVSQEDITKAVSKNSDLSEAEVEEISNNIYDGLQKTYAQAEKTFNEASVEVTKAVEQAKVTAENTVEEAKETGNDVASTSSKASLLIFVGLLLSAIAAMFGGSLGSRVSNERFIEEN